ncbi:uncharacterized protein LOC118202304 [Stegodyphus dumicola]|uniref:uncharacterized protein LOC118202304 n=1 Tax=Stegodyphus dumicola TaxID=202533 RepID=UPI0015B12D5B|nr:uncharacterized protein LOC118202304 [Stegodyphus dumicola]
MELNTTCAPFKPASNGQAGRKAPNLTILLSPAMLFLKREIRNRIDLVVPNLRRRVEERIRRNTYDFKDKNFEIGEKVAIRDYISANSRWKISRVTNKDGALHYTINVQGTLLRRNVKPQAPDKDIEQRSEAVQTSAGLKTSSVPRKTEPVIPVNPDKELQQLQPGLRRSSSIRKAPQRLNL